MNSVFITGIPASGKTYLAEKISKKLGLDVLKVDDLRTEMAKDSELKKWVHYFWDKDEAEYYATSSCDQLWQDICDQSEAMWPYIKSVIKQRISEKPHIVEGVNLLPHLIQELDLQGIVLVGESEQQIFERIQADPRWGETEELQRMEAKAFYNCEAKHYREEAKQYGFEVFSSAELAIEELELLILEK